MISLEISGVQKIDIKENKSIYSYIATKEEILSWNIRESKNPSYYLDGLIIIICKTINENKEGVHLTIEIVDPIIISKFTKKERQEKQYLIFKVENLPEILLNSFIKSSKLNNLVEMKSTNLSKNSLKLITYSSLENLIFEIFEFSNYSNTDELGSLFKDYFEQLIKVNSLYFPNSLREVQEIKEKTVIHNLNSWYILLCFFKEQLEDNVVDIQIPNLTMEIKYKNWTGTFFDRENPIWEELYPNSRKNYPSKKIKIKTYNHWKKLTKELPSE
ncbi:hypothetical protein [Peribacillus sp. NPDC058075]|uniref:hypothetical protein n=1 Tax=unclassified Peribacillus TaxID=2675266 RepID=UPI0036D793F6